MGIKSRTARARRRGVSAPSGGKPFTAKSVGVLAGIVLLSSACAAPGVVPAAQPSAPATDRPAVGAQGVQGRDVGDAVDPLAPRTDAAPVRTAEAPPARMSAGSGRFAVTAPVRFADGVVVTVESVKKGAEDGKGPGVIPGRSYVGYNVRIVNKSTRAIDLSQVVVTMTYGEPARVASPVYQDPTARDFAGTVTPGAAASAVYFFAVPVQDRGKVSTSVDFDPTHAAAVFSGAVG